MVPLITIGSGHVKKTWRVEPGVVANQTSEHYGNVKYTAKITTFHDENTYISALRNCQSE